MLTDTFQMTEDGDTLDTKVFTSNNDRVVEQNALDIRVIVGNPPYSKGQTSGNDNNANMAYPSLDESIRTTYAARSTARLKNSLYDSYIRAIRWASNRVLGSENGGVVCYVSNGGYVDGNTADGLRLSLTDEFHDIYVYNLRGNARTSGELRRRERDNIFGEGSKTTTAILLLVKRTGPVDKCHLHYKDIGDYLDRKTKLATVEHATLESLDWQTLFPNEQGDWINLRDPKYESYPLIAEKGNPRTIFNVNSGGLKTNRDAWVYNFSKQAVEANVERMSDFFNSEVARYAAQSSAGPPQGFVNRDPALFSWDRADYPRLRRGETYEMRPDSVRLSTYRPFSKQQVCFDRRLNNTVYRLNELFPTPDHGTVGFYNVGSGSAVPFSALMTDALPDLHVTGAGSGGQFFPRYFYTQDGQDSLFGEPVAQDNITDWALKEYRNVYGPQVTKDDIFYYVYGLLHSPEYRVRYQSDLRKALPRIPQVVGKERFEGFAVVGKKLADLHIGYEDLEPYPLEEKRTASAPADPYERYAVTKMKYGGKSGAFDKTTVQYNKHVVLRGIPEAAQEYMLGSKSALDWILERYQVKTDKASGIVNDPNDWSREHHQPRYIVDLIGRIVRLSLETNTLVASLPELVLE